MGATPEQYKDWQNRADQGTLYLSELLDELPDDQWFALGALSSWFFIGNKKRLWDDVDMLDEIYFKNMTGETPHVMFLMQKVINVYIRHWEGEHLLILLKLEGEEEGYISFERDYPAFFALAKARMENGQKLPKSIFFDKKGNIVKRDIKVRRRGKNGYTTNVITIIVYDREGNEVGRFKSIKATAQFLGIPWYSVDRMVHGERKHPNYRFELIEGE